LVFVGQTAVVGVETVQEGAQHTALRGTSAQCASGGEVEGKSHSLGLVGEKVLYPGTCESGEPEWVQFGDENVRNDCIEG